jgi:LuxR family transcriptional regulator, maltose regulon positive regulatory protein
MCGPLCDAVLKDRGSALELEKIERSNLFLVPLDHRREWHRYHHLYRELLESELLAYEPQHVPVLHRRAADWYETHGDRESAGRPTKAERWLEAAERGSSTHGGTRADGFQPRIAVVRALLCRSGAKDMLADANTAVAGLEPSSFWRPSALLLQGVALVLLGEVKIPDAVLAAAAEAAAALGSAETQAIAISERAVLAARREDFTAVESLARAASECVRNSGIDGYPSQAFELAVEAGVQLRRGQWDDARTKLTRGHGLVADLNVALPWLAVLARLELARGFITVRDRDAAAALLDDARELLDQRPGLDPADPVARDPSLVP